jgi:type II secretory pathway pseudopilin PulG
MTKKNFTLLEVIIATLILMMSFGSLLASFVAVRKYVGRTHYRLTAVNLIRGVMEDLYNDVRADSVNWVPGNKGLPDVNLDGTNYTRSFNVSKVSGYDYLQVDVTVTYPAL